MTIKATFALIFEGEVSQEFTEFSKNDYFSENGQFVLGEHAIPHITLLQFAVEESNELADIWKDVQNSEIKELLEVNMAGLCYLPSPDGSEIWLEIPTLKSQSLDSLQRHLIDLETIKGKKLFNGVLDSFRPHVTLGLLKPAPSSINLPQLPAKILRENVKAKLILGLSGENYTLTQISYGVEV